MRRFFNILGGVSAILAVLVSCSAEGSDDVSVRLPTGTLSRSALGAQYDQDSSSVYPTVTVEMRAVTDVSWDSGSESQTDTFSRTLSEEELYSDDDDDDDDSLIFDSITIRSLPLGKDVAVSMKVYARVSYKWPESWSHTDEEEGQEYLIAYSKTPARATVGRDRDVSLVLTLTEDDDEESDVFASRSFTYSDAGINVSFGPGFSATWTKNGTASTGTYHYTGDEYSGTLWLDLTDSTGQSESKKYIYSFDGGKLTLTLAVGYSLEESVAMGHTFSTDTAGNSESTSISLTQEYLKFWKSGDTSDLYFSSQNHSFEENQISASDGGGSIKATYTYTKKGETEAQVTLTFTEKPASWNAGINEGDTATLTSEKVEITLTEE